MIDVTQWQPLDGFVFEPNALKAIKTIDVNTVVSAGPGAGKTELLAQRAHFLLRTGNSKYPRRILAVSFKVDAARNLEERVRLRTGATLSSRFDSFTFHAFAKRIVDNFRTLLRGEDWLRPDYTLDPEVRVPHTQITFDDLIDLALQIIECHPQVKNIIKHTYSHVLLDEFQDCTGPQYELVSAIFKNTGTVLTAVGDSKQKIMKWAGALDGIMQTYAYDFTATSLPLYQNFRSAPRLRRMQNRMIARIDPQAVSPPEDLLGERGCIQTLSFDRETDEAQHLAALIEDWIEQGTEPNEIAVLVRQQAALMTSELSNVLTAKGLPWRNEQLHQDLLSEPVSQLILNYFRLLSGDANPDAYSSLMKLCQTSYPSDEEAARLDSQLKELLQVSRQILSTKPYLATDHPFWQQRLDELFKIISQPLLRVLSLSYLQEDRLADVINETLKAFIHELDLSSSPTTALNSLSGLDSIRLSTIHKSKGLEFEKVIVLGVEQESFWGEARDVLSTFFVGISRAKDTLILTSAQRRERPRSGGKFWRVRRVPHRELLNFALESSA